MFIWLFLTMRNVSELAPPPSRVDAPHLHGGVGGEALFYRVLLGSLLAHLAALAMVLTYPAPTYVRATVLNETQARRWLLSTLTPTLPKTTPATLSLANSAAPPPATEASITKRPQDSPGPPSNKLSKPPGESLAPQGMPAEPEDTRAPPDVEPAEPAAPAVIVTSAPMPALQALNSPSTTRGREADVNRAADGPGRRYGAKRVPRTNTESQRGRATPNHPTGRRGTSALAANEDPNALRTAYLQQLVPNVRGHYFYPQNARRLGLEGRVLVALEIDARGDVLEVILH